MQKSILLRPEENPVSVQMPDYSNTWQPQPKITCSLWPWNSTELQPQPWTTDCKEHRVTDITLQLGLQSGHAEPKCQESLTQTLRNTAPCHSSLSCIGTSLIDCFPYNEGLSQKHCGFLMSSCWGLEVSSKWFTITTFLFWSDKSIYDLLVPSQNTKSN